MYVTISTLVLLVVLYLVDILRRVPYPQDLCPFISPLLHGNSNHLFWNCVCYVILANKLEASYGSLLFMIVQIVGAVTSHFSFTAILLAQGSYRCVCGFSGVLYFLAVVEVDTCVMFLSNQQEITRMRLFGTVYVTRKYATILGLVPWVLLGFNTYFLPNSSFEGHFAGCVAGTVVSVFARFVFPGQTWLMEQVKPRQYVSLITKKEETTLGV